MVMLATEQQIANYLVYKHYQPRRIVCLCTDLAIRQDWCCGFERLGIDVTQVRIPQTLDVATLSAVFEKILREHLEKHIGNTIWAWAGAQKPHATALYLTARSYAAKAPERHHIVYAEGNTQRFIIDGDPAPVLPNLALSFQEIMNVHGLRVKLKDEWEPDDEYEEKLDAFVADQSVREELWQEPELVSRLRELVSQDHIELSTVAGLFTEAPGKSFLSDFSRKFEELLRSDNKQNKTTANAFSKALQGAAKEAPISSLDAGTDGFSEALQEATKHRFVRDLFLRTAQKLGVRLRKKVDSGVVRTRLQPSKEFERIAQTRLRRWEKGKGKGKLACLEFGIEVEGINLDGNYASERSKGPAEFDCLMLTPAGQIIFVDFKSAGHSSRYRHQHTSVRVAGGRYAELYYLYPWIVDDLPAEHGGVDGDKPEAVRKRMDGVIKMHEFLCPKEERPYGLRFLKNDEDFYDELESVLRL